ncbi:MAG: c-type cytochrome [Acidobacteria bacterium]|nr:c-type cytochrome [Acidobacteriota bacterium]
MKICLVVSWAVLFLVTGAASSEAAAAARSRAAPQSADDLEQGKKLFEGMCARCHGLGGGGGEGPSLNRPRLTRAGTNDDLREVIREGIPSRGMPRTRRTSDNEMRQLVVYVRSLGRMVPAALAGNAEKGIEIYNRLGCASCHIIKGQGGSLGPELTEIGMLRAADHLREALMDPGSKLPRGVMLVPSRGFAEYLPVRVVTTDGREVRGMRVNEDSFTIQVRDARNRYHSFRKGDLRRLEKEFGTSLMPSYKDRLAGSDADDLVAFLASLGGAR